MIRRSSKGRNKQKQLEADIQLAILDWLKWNENKLGFFYRTKNNPSFHTGGKAFITLPKHTPKGVADITGVLKDGRACYIEVKRKGSYQSKEQKSFQSSVENFGALYFVARSIEDCQEHLKNYL